MTWLGDYKTTETLTFHFTTRQFTSGAPFTLAGTPSLAVYKAGSLTQDTGACSLSVNHDGVTGFHLVTVDLGDTGAAAGFYAHGSQYDVIVAAGTVDAVSVAGEVIGRFRLANGANIGYIDGDTGAADNLQKMFDTAPSYFGRVDVRQIIGDTGAANQLQQAFATAPSYFQSVDVVRVMTDTGAGSSMRDFFNGAGYAGGTIKLGVNLTQIGGDTGAGNHLRQFIETAGITAIGGDMLDTGTMQTVADKVWDTLRGDHTVAGSFGQRVLADVTHVDGDTGAANHLREFTDALKSNGYIDTGTYEGAGVPTSITDTGTFDDIADHIFNKPQVDGYKFIEAFRLMAAVLAGKVSGAGTGTETMRSLDDTTDRIVSTVDDDGNRTALTYLVDT